MQLLLKILGFVLISGLVAAWYLGLLSSVLVEDSREGGFTVVGLEYTGPYSGTRKHMKEVEDKLKNAGITSARGFGIYYDDPKTTDSEKCRSFLGIIPEDSDSGKIPGLRSKGFKVDSIPVSNAAVTTFPVKSSISYMIGPMKVYPALSQFMTKNKYILTLSMEIYDVPAKQIQYIMQYEKSEKADESIDAPAEL